MKKKRISSLWRNVDDTVRARIRDLWDEGGRELGPRGTVFDVDLFYRDPPRVATAGGLRADRFYDRASALEWLCEEVGEVWPMRLPAEAETFTHGWHSWK